MKKRPQTKPLTIKLPILPKAEIQIERTRRTKTIGISVKNENTVRVLVPKDLPRSDIEAILYKKRSWIERQLQESSKRPQRHKHRFVSGETFFFLGKGYTLRLFANSQKFPENQPVLSRKYLNLHTPDTSPAYLQEILKRWYIAEAATILKERIHYFETRLGLKHTDLKLKKLKSRWGSCNARGSVVLNWLIIQAPLEIVDLVVVHELCHLQEMNHSPAFWNLVASQIPDYKERRKWLRQNGHLLGFA